MSFMVLYAMLSGEPEVAIAMAERNIPVMLKAATVLEANLPGFLSQMIDIIEGKSERKRKKNTFFMPKVMKPMPKTVEIIVIIMRLFIKLRRRSLRSFANLSFIVLDSAINKNNKAANNYIFI